jgi:hypothetical protein
MLAVKQYYHATVIPQHLICGPVSGLESTLTYRDYFAIPISLLTILPAGKVFREAPLNSLAAQLSALATTLRFDQL